MWLKYDVATVKLFSLNRRDRSQAGFAMPLSLGLGLVMIIVAASMIGRSQSDRTSTNIQKETNRALSVAEAGAIRAESFLDRYKLLANKNLDLWVDTLNNLPEPQANCSAIDLPVAKRQVEIFKTHQWINLDQADLNKGRYRIVDYKYQGGIGQLTIAGEIDAYNTNQHTSTSTLMLAIPITSESAQAKPPALWTQLFNLSPTQKVSGDIRAATCPRPSASDPDGIGGIDGSNIQNGSIVGDPFTAMPAIRITPNTATRLSAITKSIQLPRSASTDVPDANGEYHYLIDIDNPKSGYSIKLQDSDRLKISVTGKQKVNLYLKGNIDLAGSQTIDVHPAHPNLRIYGSDRTTELNIKNNASITAFIHAPLATVRITNGTTPNPSRGITGALWVKGWDSGINQSEIPLTQMGDWSDLGIGMAEQPPQLSPITYWQRVESK
jgi:hypothetical protein